MKIRLLQALLIAIGLYCLGLNLAQAADSKTDLKLEREYRHSRSFYETLLKEDPNVRNLIAWESAGAELQQFVRNHPESRYVPDALFSLGRMFERTFQYRRFSSGLTKAVFYYEQLSRDFRGNDLADDALLSLGDLRRDGLKDEVAARAAYFEIIDRYPKGDQVAEAKARLGLAAGTLQSGGEGASGADDQKGTLGDVSPRASKGESSENSLSVLFGGRDSGGRDILTDQSSVKRPLVVIDPGHGGDNMGAVGVGGILEKNVTLVIAKEIDRLLRERLRARTLLTRTDDISLPLNERTNLANTHNADLFISVHTNASELKNVYGVETYYLDNTHDKSSLKLADRENSVGDTRGAPGDLNFILSDLIQNAKLEDSISLAHLVQDGLTARVSQYYEGVKSLGVKKAPFYVLVGAHMPCVLVEVSFIDHPIEGKRLSEPRYQTLVADGIYRGIRAYFESRWKMDESGSAS